MHYIHSKVKISLFNNEVSFVGKKVTILEIDHNDTYGGQAL